MSYDPPEVAPDASDSTKHQFHLPKTRIPEPLMKGIRGHRTSDGYLVLRLHYSADPEADEEWKQERVQGYRGGFEGRDWQREMEIDFGSFAGLPVYPAFDQASIKPVKYNPFLPLWRGWDFGYRNPAVTFMQLWEDDTLVFLHEIFPTLDKEKVPGIKTADLCQIVLEETARLFPSATDLNESAGVFDFCDPSGNQKKETSDLSSVEIMQQYGIDPEWSQVGRKNRVERARRYVEGKHADDKPKFLINPHCKLGIKAFSSAYRYPEDTTGGADREMPDVSRKVQQEPYIHIMDSFEYVVAVNLEITDFTHPTKHKGAGPETLVTDLASAYLGAVSEVPDRVASLPKKRDQGEQDLEVTLYELIGEDSLDDAFLLS